TSGRVVEVARAVFGTGAGAGRADALAGGPGIAGRVHVGRARRNGRAGEGGDAALDVHGPVRRERHAGDGALPELLRAGVRGDALVEDGRAAAGTALQPVRCGVGRVLGDGAVVFVATAAGAVRRGGAGLGGGHH